MKTDEGDSRIAPETRVSKKQQERPDQMMVGRSRELDHFFHGSNGDFNLIVIRFTRGDSLQCEPGPA